MRGPKIKLKSTGIDWALDSIGIVGIILMIVYVIMCYNDLPNTIPKHYTATGQADGFGGRSILLVLPALTIVIFLILTVSLKFPHLFNYPFAVTDENAERQYKNLTLMVRILKTLMVGIFLFLTYATIQNGLGNKDGLGTWFTALALFSVLGTVGFFIYKGFKLQ
jgi:uncharacterized membrane protein